jgi:hypothetical protein
LLKRFDGLTKFTYVVLMSYDFDCSDSFFFNDDSSSRSSFFVDSGDDERREPEFDIGDFDGDGSEF